MNPVLQNIFETGCADGKSLPLRSHITRTEGIGLQRVVRDLQPHVSLEVGMAHGVSTLFICEALPPESRHIVIDPFQFTDWHGVGVENLHRAGYEVELVEEPSELALPRLAREGLRIDFAFIDGSHMFDHALLDFFYIDLMLRIGGVVAFDDMSGWPSVRKVGRFILTNREYSPYAAAGPSGITDGIIGPTLRTIPRLRRVLRPEVLQSDQSLGLSQSRLVAFRKEAEDSRVDNERCCREF